jgi:hypothetical protein
MVGRKSVLARCRARRRSVGTLCLGRGNPFGMGENVGQRGVAENPGARPMDRTCWTYRLPPTIIGPEQGAGFLPIHGPLSQSDFICAEPQ